MAKFKIGIIGATAIITGKGERIPEYVDQVAKKFVPSVEKADLTF